MVLFSKKKEKETSFFNMTAYLKKQPIQEFYDLLEDVEKYDSKRDIQARDVLIDELICRLEFLKGKEFINNSFENEVPPMPTNELSKPTK